MSTRGMCLAKLKNQKMTGGIFEIIRMKRQFDEMELEKQKNAAMLNKLETDQETALIRDA